MLKKMELIFCIVILTTSASWTGGAFAGDYTVGWWHLQKRTYENGDSFNRLGFSVIDEFGSPVSSDVVLSIALVGPGVPDPLPAHHFNAYETLYGHVDTSSGQWIYDPDFTADNYYGVTFSGDLVEGNYTLTVIDTDGATMTNDNATRRFNGVVELPTISSNSFRGSEDAAGNVIIQWDPPMDTDLWSTSIDVSSRCWLSIFLGDVWKGEIWVTVPAIVGGMYIPSNVMDLARQKGDNFRFGMHLRTNDNNNRYYPNSIALSALKSERPKKTVVIPLF